jgi:hypothetical protein
MPPTRKEMALAVLILTALPVLLEIALRLTHVQFEPQLYTGDRELGWKLRAGTSGVVSIENRQFVQVNSHGFRDRDRSYEKPPDTIRIAVLGNSWTEALQVPLEKTYVAVLEQKLAELGCFAPKHVEVLNFGVAGYSTAQELMLLHQEVWKYHPDIVLLAFYPARDIANNARELNNAVNPEQSPYYVYRQSELVLDDSFQSVPDLEQRQILFQNLHYHLSRRVVLLQAISAMQRFGRTQFAMRGVREKAEKVGMDNLEYAIYSPPVDPVMQNAWRVTEGLFLLLRDEVKSHGAEFRIVTLATRPQVIPDRTKRTELMRKLGVADFSYSDERIRLFGRQGGISVTNLSTALSEYAETHQIYLNGFRSSNYGTGHWNEAGHKLAAEVIAENLCSSADRKESQVTVLGN